MERLSEPVIACVDTMPNAILVTFQDGKCAVFSASLLYATLSQAQMVKDDLEPDTALRAKQKNCQERADTALISGSGT
jgi:hypothetical protein